jgi:cytoskeletal protein CcmA (bactofilin family)
MSRNRTEGKLDTVVGPDTHVKGDFRVTGCLRLDGQIEGKVEVAETLLTGTKSIIKGDVHCRAAVIAGRIEGDVTASEIVELQTGAQVFGDIRCRGIVIQRDCFFQGNCTMSGGEPAS